MIGYSDFSSMPALNIPHKLVTMEEAVTAYKNGQRVGIIQKYYSEKASALIMDKNSIFTCDFDYLVSCQWVIFS